MGLNQQQLEVLASGKDTGAYFGVVQGIFFDRFGPTLTILVGGALDFVGYLGVWSYAHNPPSVLHLWARIAPRSSLLFPAAAALPSLLSPTTINHPSPPPPAPRSPGSSSSSPPTAPAGSTWAR